LKGLETERRPGNEKQVMTADQIIVGIDDSPSARAALRWPAAYARSTGIAFCAIDMVDEPRGTPILHMILESRALPRAFTPIRIVVQLRSAFTVL
jgi:hypothetical protein